MLRLTLHKMGVFFQRVVVVLVMLSLVLLPLAFAPARSLSAQDFTPPAESTAEPSATPEVTDVAPPVDDVGDEIPVAGWRVIFDQFRQYAGESLGALFSRDNLLALFSLVFSIVIGGALYAVYKSVPPGALRDMLGGYLDVNRRQQQEALDRFKAGVGTMQLPEPPLGADGTPLAVRGVRVHYADGSEVYVLPEQLRG